MFSGLGKILIVEDDKNVRETLYDILNIIFPERVLCCENGVQALSYTRDPAHEIGVIILDVNMPVMGGVELLENIKISNHPSLKIVISGYVKNKDDEHLLSMCDHFLEKPVDLKLIVKIIKEKGV